jgi:hypothetical protein
MIRTELYTILYYCQVYMQEDNSGTFTALSLTAQFVCVCCHLAEQALPPPGAPTVLYSNGTCGIPYSLPNGVTLFCSADGSSYLIPAQQQVIGFEV